MPQNISSGLRSKLDQERVPSGGGAWRLMSFMIFVFAVFLISYLGLELGYKNFVSAAIADKEKELADLATQVPEKDQEEFLKFQYQIINLKNILDNHVISSRVFPFVESNTNSQVFFKSMDVNVEENKINLEAVARSYEVVAEQLSALQSRAEVVSYEITGAKAIEGGRVQFDIALKMSPKSFR